MRFSIVLLIVACFAADARSQIKIEGPPEATVGYRVKAKLTLDVTDPKIQCFPLNDDWFAVQDFNGNKFIDFVPGKRSVPQGKDSQLFTFVIAGNKAGKTYLELWEVTVKPDGEVVPPEPEAKSDLYKAMFAAYRVSPNADSLKLHIKLYSEFLADVKADKFTSAKQAGDALKAKFELVPDLQSVEDVVTDYLVKHVGSSWNKDKLVTAFDVIIATLKMLKP